MTGCAVVVIVSVFEVKGNVLWQKGEVGEDVVRIVQRVSRDEMAFAQMGEGEKVCGKVGDRAGGAEGKGKKVVT